MTSRGSPAHASHSDNHAGSHHRETGAGPFPGFSQPASECRQDSNLGRRASGELSCWEKRLKGAQEKLQLMRLEREQWYAMASAADSAKKKPHSGVKLTNSCELSCFITTSRAI